MARKATTTTPTEKIDPVATRRSQALVFISHDSRDADLAEAFADLLTGVSAGTLKSFRSSDKKGSTGIGFGTEWYTAIMSRLGDATDVVALLTQHSIDRPWILYEAGVAKGKLNTNVLGVALGVPLEKVSTGPFGQFQNCSDDEESLTKLVMQLLERIPEASPSDKAVRLQVQSFIESHKKLISTKGKPAAVVTDESNVAKLFEEVKVMVRELPDRIDDRVRTNGKRNSSIKQIRRFHPMMVKELLFHPRLRESASGPASAWLLFLAALRPEIPWLYDVGQELYQALRTGDIKVVRAARTELIAILEATAHSPLLHELMRPEDEEVFLFVRHLPEMIDRFVEPLLEDEPHLKRRKLFGDRKAIEPSAKEVS